MHTDLGDLVVVVVVVVDVVVEIADTVFPGVILSVCKIIPVLLSCVALYIQQVTYCMGSVKVVVVVDGDEDTLIVTPPPPCLEEGVRRRRHNNNVKGCPGGTASHNSRACRASSTV